MVDLDLVLRLSQILFAALIAIVPPFYPQKSLYVMKAQEGLEKLRETRAVFPEKDTEKGLLLPGEEGFKQIIQAIRRKHPITSEVQEISWEHYDPEEVGVEFTTTGAMTTERAVFFIKYKEVEEPDVLIQHPFNPKETLKLKELENWIANNAEHRSHYITTVLAISWTVVSVIYVL